MANPETIRAARCPAPRPRGTAPPAAWRSSGPSPGAEENPDTAPDPSLPCIAKIDLQGRPLAAPGCCNQPVWKVHSCSGSVQFETYATVVKVLVPTPGFTPFEPGQCRYYARGKRSSRGQEPSLRLEADEPAQVIQPIETLPVNQSIHYAEVLIALLRPRSREAQTVDGPTGVLPSDSTLISKGNAVNREGQGRREYRGESPLRSGGRRLNHEYRLHVVSDCQVKPETGSRGRPIRQSAGELQESRNTQSRSDTAPILSP